MTNSDTPIGGQEQSPSEFCRTPTCLAIWHALERARRRATMAVILGPAGTGKTVTAHAFAAANPKVHGIQLSSRTRTPVRLLEVLQHHFFGDTRTVSERDLFSAIRREPGSLLIVDEAHHLSDAALELLRDLNDPGRWGANSDFRDFMIGIALVGNPVLVSEREGKNRHLYSQILSRIRPRVIFDELLPEDYEVFFDHNGIAGARCRKRIQAVADRRVGALRIAMAIIETAREIADNQPVTIDHIEEAITIQGFQ